MLVRCILSKKSCAPDENFGHESDTNEDETPHSQYKTKLPSIDANKTALLHHAHRSLRLFKPPWLKQPSKERHMTRFQNFIQDQPGCFGTRLDIAPSTKNCGICAHINACLSAVWAVLDAVKTEQLPANGYFPGELQEMRRRHQNVCDSYCMEADQEFPPSFISSLHERVLPQRSTKEIENARVFNGLLDDLCDGIDSPSASELNDTIIPDNADTKSESSVGIGATASNAHDDIVEAPPTSSVADAAPVPATVTKASPANYEFVGLELRKMYTGLSNEELEAEHTRLCEQTWPRHTKPVCYSQIRDSYCAASIVMNERGLRPPRFRAACKGEKWQRGMTWTDEMKAMSNDMKIIELDWLHGAGVCSPVRDYEFSELLKSKEFDFDLATRFVITKWKAETRAMRILVLADVEQWQLSKLASAEVNKRWSRVIDDAIAVERRLKSAAYRRPQLAHEVDDFKRLWIADQMCGGVDQRLIGMVHGWQKGKPPLAASTLSGKLKSMRRWTTES